MYVDVINVGGLHASILEGILHDKLCTEAFGMGCGDVMCVGTHACSAHLGIDLCTASLCMFKFLENEHSATFSHDEAVATGTEGTACLLRLVVPCAQGMHCREASHASCGDGSFGASAHDDIGLAQTDEVEGIGQGIR